MAESVDDEVDALLGTGAAAQSDAQEGHAEDADGDEAPPTFEEALTLCPVHADAAAGTENGDDGGEQAPALAVLMAMGFARDAAAAALSQAANDVERAAALLLESDSEQGPGSAPGGVLRADRASGDVDSDEELAKALYLSELQQEQRRLQAQVQEKERENEEKQKRQTTAYGSPFDFGAVGDVGEASAADSTGTRRGGWPSGLGRFATKAAAVGNKLDAKLTKAADKLDKSADRLADKATAGVQKMSKNLSSRAASWKSSLGKKISDAASEVVIEAKAALDLDAPPLDSPLLCYQVGCGWALAPIEG